MPTRSHINAATSDDGARRIAYGKAAEEAGLTFSQWVLKTLDGALPEDVQESLPPLAKNGEKGRGRKPE